MVRAGVRYRQGKGPVGALGPDGAVLAELQKRLMAVTALPAQERGLQFEKFLSESTVSGADIPSRSAVAGWANGGSGPLGLFWKGWRQSGVVTRAIH